jgi:ATP-dependent protease ClpP protease subunit
MFMAAPAPITVSHALVFSGPINTPLTNSLRNQLAFLNQPQSQNVPHLPCTGLLIVLASWGGNTFEARSIYGVINSLSFPVEIHAVGVVQSAAVPLMLAAQRRTASPDATFLFHPWTWGSEPHPGRTLDELQQYPMRLEDDVKWARNTFVERTNLTEAKVSELNLFEVARIENADFALTHGIIHEKIERKIPHGIMTWNVST